MCVILQCEKEKDTPNLDMLREAEKTNPHGGGIAYNLGDGFTYWEKGIHVTADYVNKLIKKYKLKNKDFIVHFRIATHGAINDNLCHPFLMDKTGKNLTKGRTKKGVMFHNGVWNEYDDYAVKLAFNRNVNIPDGDISDSSIMAWIASNVGINFLDMIGEKVTVINPDGITRFGEGWTEVNNIVCSNDLFEPTAFWGYQDNYTVKRAQKIDEEVDEVEEEALRHYSKRQGKYINDTVFNNYGYDEYEDEFIDNMKFYQGKDLKKLDS